MGEKLSPIFCLDKFVFFSAVARNTETWTFCTCLVALLGYYLIYKIMRIFRYKKVGLSANANSPIRYYIQ